MLVYYVHQLTNSPRDFKNIGDTMSSVVASVTGGSPKRVTASTVQDAKNALGLSGNYQATVNGESAELSDTLSDEDFVSFSLQVKGGYISLRLAQ